MDYKKFQKAQMPRVHRIKVRQIPKGPKYLDKIRQIPKTSVKVCQSPSETIKGRLEQARVIPKQKWFHPS
jgi:hypothetical protein